MTEQTTATAEANTEPFDAAYITETARIAAENESRQQNLEVWLSETIAPLWTEFLKRTYAQIGWRGVWWTTYTTGEANGYWLDLSLTSEGAYWSGRDRDGDFDSFTIPWDFINPATRAAAEARIAGEIRAEQSRRNAEQAREQAERDAKKRAQDEATLRDLAARLGKTVIDQDVED